MQKPLTDWLFEEIKQSSLLALPLVAAALAQMGMEIVDTLMMGRLGSHALASGSLGSSIFIFLLVICIGVITAVGVLVARHYGAGRKKAAMVVFHQSLWLVVALSIPVTLIMWYAPQFLLLIGEKADIVAGTQLFLHGLAFGVFPVLAFFALRELVSALSKPTIIMLVSMLVIPLNVLANYILMYGKLGFPVLGIAGIGYASSFIEWLSLAALMIYVFYHPTFSQYRLFRTMEWPRPIILWEITRLGMPVGILFGFETGLFSIATVMMGYFGAESLAAHQIALQSLNVAFMLPLGFSQAAAVRVSQALGANNREKAKHAAYVGIFLGLVSATITAACFWLFPKQITQLFIDVKQVSNQPVLHQAVVFLGIAAIFEIMDALQVLMTGILRGLKDTLAPMLLGLLSYWCFGLGAAYLLAFKLDKQGVGIWWGLAIGIGVSAALLIWRFAYCIRSVNLNEV